MFKKREFKSKLRKLFKIMAESGDDFFKKTEILSSDIGVIVSAIVAWISVIDSEFPGLIIGLK